MSNFRKAKIMLTSVYNNGDVLTQDAAVPARVSILPIPGADKFRELSVRMVVDTGIAEELLEGLCRGVVSLNVEQMVSAAERETKS